MQPWRGIAQLRIADRREGRGLRGLLDESDSTEGFASLHPAPVQLLETRYESRTLPLAEALELSEIVPKIERSGDSAV